MASTSITAFFRANGDQFIQTIGRMDRSTSRFERNATGSFTRLTRQMRGLGGVFAGFSTAVAVRELGRFAEGAQRLDNLLIAAGDNSDEFKRRLLATAIDTRAPIEGLANALLRLQKADPSATLDQSLERVATFQRLSLFGGRTAQEASAAALQLSQAIQSGQLSGDEFRSISENAAPEYLNELARLAGVARSELKATASQGKLTSDLLIQALDNLSGYSREVVADLPRTLSQASTAVSDAFTLMVGEVDDSLGATERLANILGGLADLFVAGSEHAEGLANSLRLVANAALIFAAGRAGGAMTRAFAQSVASIGAETRALEVNRVGLNNNRRDAMQTALQHRQLARLRQQTVASLQAEGAAQSRVNRAQIQATQALYRYQASRAQSLRAARTYRASLVSARAATDGLTLATLRLSVAGRAISGLVGLFGGIPGVLFAAAAAATVFITSQNKVADAIARSEQSMTGLEAVTDRLQQAEGDYAKAIEARASASESTNESELARLDALLKSSRALTQEELDRAKIQSTITQQDLADTSASLAPRIVTTDRRGDRIVQAARLDPEGSLRNELADYQERLRLNEELSAGERARFEQVRNHVADLDRAAERTALIATIEGRHADTLDIVSQHYARNTMAREAATAALTTQEAVLARVEANEKRLNALVAERAILEAALAEPQRLSAEYANQLRRELEAVNSEIERFAPIVAGSQNELEAMRGTAADLSATLQDAEFDPDGELARRAADVTLRLEEAIAAGLDLNSVEMAALREELRSVEEQALNAAVAIASARAQARAGYEANDATFDPRGDGYDPVAAAFQDFQGQRNLYTPPERVTVPSGGGGSRRNRTSTGGGSRQTEAQRQVETDMKTALDFIRSQRTEEEAQADRLTELLELRGRLVGTYGDEAEIVADLDTALERMQRASLDWAKSLTTDILKAVAAGEDLDQVLDLIFTRIFDAALSGVIDQVFGAIGSGVIGGGQPSGGGGGGILKAIGGFFGFAKGGVMTPQGPVPLRKYAKGGVAHSPQLALFGEGSGAEAFVPLESGAIPVRLNFPNIDKIRDATATTVNRVTSYVDNTVINVSAPDGGNDALVASIRQEMVEREARIMQTIRDANEDDPNFLT